MDATSFEFTMTMPGDQRLVGAVRDLAAHAAGYAHMDSGVAAALVEEVARAAATAIDATGSRNAPIEFRFVRQAATLDVFIACEAATSGPPSPPASTDGLSVEWTRDGSRQICHIRQQVPV